MLILTYNQSHQIKCEYKIKWFHKKNTKLNGYVKVRSSDNVYYNNSYYHTIKESLIMRINKFNNIYQNCIEWFS